MRIAVDAKNWEEWQEHFGHNVNRLDVFRQTLGKYDGSPVGHKVILTLDSELAFKERVTGKGEILDSFLTVLGGLRQWGVHEYYDSDTRKRVRNDHTLSILEIVMTQTDIDRIAEQIHAIDEGLRDVEWGMNFEMSCKHPKFSGLSLKAWKGYTTKLFVHPVYWKEDVRHIREAGFKITITKKNEALLNALEAEELGKIETVHVRQSAGGFAVFVYPLQDKISDRINSVVTVKYNRMQDDGSYREEDMGFVNRLRIPSLENGVTLEESDEEGAYPREFYDLSTDGYKPYECAMFTLPAIDQFLRMQGVKVTGLEDIYPDFPKFDFPVQRVQDNLSYRDMPHQDEAYKSWTDAGSLGTIALPTGSGKTLIGLRAIADLKVRTLIVTPTIEMLHQWKRMIVEWLNVPEERVGLYYSGSKEIRDITIITFQSGHRRVTAETQTDIVDDIVRISEQAGLIIMDEGHHAPAPVFQRIMINVKSRWRMSLTATPFREDKNEALAFLALGGVVITKDYASLAEEGVVSPIKFNRVAVPFTEAENEIMKLKAEFQTGQHLPSGYYFSQDSKDEATEKLIGLWKEHDWTLLREELRGEEIEMSEPRDVPARHIAFYASGKFRMLKEIIDKHVHSKVLVFNEYVEGAKVLKMFIDNETDADVEVMTGGTSPGARKRIFKNFQSSEHAVLVTTTVLDEGIDVPDCDVVVIFNGSRSKRQMIQRVGRGCRYRPGKVEHVYELIAAPADAGSGATEASRSRNWYSYRQPGTDDAKVIARMRAKRKQGGRVGYQHEVGWRTSAEKMALRELQLYEYEMAGYRDISDIIDPERQQALIDAMEGSQ